MKESWLLRQTPKTVSRIRTLAVFLLLGGLGLLALGLIWLLDRRGI
ncbi:MAG: hypothetical protein IT578_05435 [Verrucomicrobiae bacterium]|nr:hypothetical protein [Verrucomicrobiae bacterium]